MDPPIARGRGLGPLSPEQPRSPPIPVVGARTPPQECRAGV